MKRIYHYCGAGRNYGDMALISNLQRMLRKRSPHELEFAIIDLKNPRESLINGDKVKEMNEYGDMLLVGGGGLFMAGDRHDTVSGWQFNISKVSLRELEIPLIIYGAGWNVFPGDKPLGQHAESHILETYNASTLFSVRNWGTNTKLDHIGVPTAHLVPDPGYFCKPASIHLPKIYRDTYCVGICWPGDRVELRNSNEELTNLERVDLVANQLKDLLQLRNNSKVVFIPHVSLYDMPRYIINRFREILGDKFYNIAEQLPFLYPEKMEYVSVIAGIYSHMDVVVGMRGHSCMIPYGLGVPVVAFGDHDKLRFFASATDSPLATLEPGNLKQHLKAVTNTTYKNKQLAKMSQMRQDADRFNQRVIDCLNGHY